MNQNYNQTQLASGLQQQAGMGMCGSAPAAPDSMPSLLDEVGKMAYEVNSLAAMFAAALAGPIPAEGKDGCGQSADNVMDKLRLIRSTLFDAIQSQQRIRNTLSL